MISKLLGLALVAADAIPPAEHYTVDGLEVESFTLGTPNKVLIQLHGGGMTRDMWRELFNTTAKGTTTPQNWY